MKRCRVAWDGGRWGRVGRDDTLRTSPGPTSRCSGAPAGSTGTPSSKKRWRPTCYHRAVRRFVRIAFNALSLLALALLLSLVALGIHGGRWQWIPDPPATSTPRPFVQIEWATGASLGMIREYLPASHVHRYSGWQQFHFIQTRAMFGWNWSGRSDSDSRPVLVCRAASLDLAVSLGLPDSQTSITADNRALCLLRL